MFLHTMIPDQLVEGQIAEPEAKIGRLADKVETLATLHQRLLRPFPLDPEG